MRTLEETLSRMLVLEWNYLRSNYPDARLKGLHSTGYPGYRKARKYGNFSFETTKQNLS